MRDSRRTRLGATVFFIGAALLSGGCSLRSMAVNAIVPVLANPDVYRSEEDPELVRDALPFLLKTIESILDTSPRQNQALVFACTGFTLYANAFLQVDADLAEWDDYGRALAAARAGPEDCTFGRANYCLRRLDLKYRGDHRTVECSNLRRRSSCHGASTTSRCLLLARAHRGDWPSRTRLDHPELVADLPAVQVRCWRGMRSSWMKDYARGSIHGALITHRGRCRGRWEARPSGLGSTSGPRRGTVGWARCVTRIVTLAVERLEGGRGSGGVRAASCEQALADRSRTRDDEPAPAQPRQRRSGRALLLDHIDELFF